MADIVSPKVRRRMMSGIQGKNTQPELLVRRALFRLGFRYRIHDKKLPGRPDIVLKKFRAVIFVHGCFWHGHDCHLFRWPTTRSRFWRTKIQRNQIVDKRSQRDLKQTDWRILTLWECALKGRKKLPLDRVITLTSRWILSTAATSDIKGTGLFRGETLRTRRT